MLKKNYLTLLCAVALFFIGGATIFAQSSPVRGKVVIKKADGTVVPVPDATIEVYRTDIQAKLPSGKTNSKGEFSFAGFPAGARVALSVSAPGIRSDIFPDIKGGDENLTLTMIEGESKPFTEQEARQMLASAPAPNEKLTAEQKKQQEEQAKQVAKYEAEKKKVDNINTVINKAQTEGNKAFKEKNFDLAITNYDEGINADPDFEGSAPFLLNNKAIALVNRAIGKYNAALKGDPSGKAAALESVKKDLNDSLAASDKSLQILKTATNKDAKVVSAYETQKLNAYQNSLDAYSRLFSMNLDSSKGKETLATLDQYSALEKDAAAKSKWYLAVAKGFLDAGDSADAIVAYRKILEVAPENPDALAGLGLSLFSVGVATVPENTAQMQEGLNYMQKFTEVAPEDHPLKASVKEAVDYLKSKQLTPQKTPKTTTKKKS